MTLKVGNLLLMIDDWKLSSISISPYKQRTLNNRDYAIVLEFSVGWMKIICKFGIFRVPNDDERYKIVM